MISPALTLDKLQSNGINCSLDELLRYRPFAKRLNLRPVGAVRSSMSGAMLSRVKGRGMEFDEARHYQPGDDIRSIDWRVTARTGKTHTKLYREERERPVMLFVDLSAGTHFGSQLLYKSVQTLHASALITFAAIARGDKIGCMAIANQQTLEIKPKSSHKHALAMLNQLCELQNTSVNDSIEQRLQQQESVTVSATSERYQQLSSLAKPGSLVYLLSDFRNIDADSLISIGRMNRHCEIRAIRIFDPIEQALPYWHHSQDVLVSNGAHQQVLTLGDNASSKAYAQRQSGTLNNLKNQFLSLGIRLRQLSAAEPVEQQLSSDKFGFVLGAEA